MAENLKNRNSQMIRLGLAGNAIGEYGLRALSLGISVCFLTRIFGPR
jgi:hypothetical protein